MSLINEKAFDTFPVLTTERMTLRAFVQEDADQLFELRNHPKVLEYLDRPEDEGKQVSIDMIQRILESFKDHTGVSWVMSDKQTGNFLGTFGFWRLWPEHSRAEIGYTLLPKYWRKGYMRECIETCMKYAFTELGLHSVMANVNPDNEPSWKLLEAIGFKREAHFREDYYANGKFTDSYIYSCLERDLPK